MNELARLIARRIAMTGPMTVADYMATALTHPEHGYYTTRDPLGRDGDFITGPEISQVFGELIGIWCVAVWQQMGSPTQFNLVELGPGRGTLMADALRAASQVPAFVDAAELVLVETSPVLRASQAERLNAFDPVWRDSLDTVPDGPVLAIANEFFDALPAHQLVRTGAGWRERIVGRDENGLRLMLSAGETPAAALVAPDIRNGATVGAIAEVQPMALRVAAALAERIAEGGGAALIVDYGHVESAAGDTLQAVRDHEPHDVLDAPGEADLTVHVDFAALARATDDKAKIWGPATQGAFLQRMGIASRVENLSKGATRQQAETIASGAARLIGPDQMGNLFKVLCLSGHGEPQPPGFED